LLIQSRLSADGTHVLNELPVSKLSVSPKNFAGAI